jgi:hypothetical protein
MLNGHQLWVLIALLPAALTSCSSSESLHPVTGKVLLNGEPLDGAIVAFHPEGNRDVSIEHPIGSAQPDGSFTLATGQSPGARAGKYLVTIICPDRSKAKSAGMGFASQFDTEDRLKGAYADLANSKIAVEIKPGPNQLEPFNLK